MSTSSATIDIDDSQVPHRLRFVGEWTLASATQLALTLDSLTIPHSPSLAIDGAQLQVVDTTGALLILQTLQRAGVPIETLASSGIDEAKLDLIKLVADRSTEPAPERGPHRGVREMVIRVGQAVSAQWTITRDLVGFFGLTLATLAEVAAGRKRLRITSTVFHMEQVGLDAVPIVTLLSFLVGAVVAFLGATVLRDFGAEIFTVELVAYSFLREFGVLLTAILLAGRSGSAFTAQIGSMKSREELDAIRALGLDVIELLVVPRLLALLLMLPVLSFLAMLAGIIGGGLVGTLTLDITPGMFVARLYEMTEIRHFWVGLSKAPVFAFLIAIVGCLEGLKVEGSAESVGRHTTASVVQAIFLVIVFDALAAIFFMKLNV